MNAYLFTEISGIDPIEHRDEFLKCLEPLLTELDRNLKITGSARSNFRRMSLKRVMLQLTSEVIGETRARLTRAFEYFGYLDETLSRLNDSSWWIRASCCKQAGLMMSPLALPQLQSRLDDDNDDVRIEAAQALIDIGGVELIAPTLLKLKTMSLWMQVRLSRSLLTYGEHAVLPLVEASRSDYPVVQGFCVENLGILGDVKAVPTLMEYIDNVIPDVKHKSLVALGKIGDDRSIPIIKKYLESENEQLRIDAAKAAGNLSSPEMAYDLHWMLVKDTMEVKFAAAEALARSGERGIESLKYAADLPDETVRKVAKQFLHESGIHFISEEEEGTA